MNRFIMKLIPVCVVLAAVSASAQGFVRNRMTTTQPTAPAASSDAGDRDLNMVKMPLDAVFEFYGKLIDRTVLKDPNVPNVTIDLQSKVGQKLSKEEQIEAIEVVLEMNGVHIEKYGETEEPTEKRLRDKDKRRALYYQFYTDLEWGNMNHYHIILDSGSLGIEKCVDVIASLY